MGLLRGCYLVSVNVTGSQLSLLTAIIVYVVNYALIKTPILFTVEAFFDPFQNVETITHIQ